MDILRRMYYHIARSIQVMTLYGIMTQVAEGTSLIDLEVLASCLFSAGQADIFQANVSGLPATET